MLQDCNGSFLVRVISNRVSISLLLFFLNFWLFFFSYIDCSTKLPSSGSEVSQDLRMHPATFGLQNREMILLLLFQQEKKSFTETGRLFVFWKAHRIFNIDEGSWEPCGCCASAHGGKIHPHVWNRWIINIWVKSKAKYGLVWQDRCISSEIRVVAHAYWKSGAVLDVLDLIAQQGRCDFVPEVSLKYPS